MRYEYIFAKIEDLFSIENEIFNCTLLIKEMEETEEEVDLLRERIKVLSNNIIINFALYNKGILLISKYPDLLSNRPFKMHKCLPRRP